jgi:DNA-binding response OmpR family regulator
MDSLQRLDDVRTRLGVNPSMGRILLALYAAPGKFVGYSELVSAVNCDDPKAHALKVTIHRLRQRIGPEKVERLYGRGYRLSEDGLRLVAKAIGESE